MEKRHEEKFTDEELVIILNNINAYLYSKQIKDNVKKLNKTDSIYELLEQIKNIREDINI